MAEYYISPTGDDSTGDGSIGNPWRSPGYAASQMSSGDTTWIKLGTYTISVNSANASNGYVNNTTLNSVWRFRGYETTPGDNAGKPTINVSVSTVGSGLFRDTNAVTILENLIIDGSGGASSQVGFLGSSANTRSLCLGVEFLNCGGSGLNGGTANAVARSCIAENCGTGFLGCSASECYASNCDFGFQTGAFIGSSVRVFCIAHACEIGFGRQPNNSIEDISCIAYDCDSHGFDCTDSLGRVASILSGCIAVNNGGYGFYDGSSGVDRNVLINCADFGNTSGRKTGPIAIDQNPITLTADPFVDAANGNFNLNDTAGGGAVLRAASVALEDTNLYPFRQWLEDVGGGGSGPARIRQGNALGRSF